MIRPADATVDGAGRPPALARAGRAWLAAVLVAGLGIRLVGLSNSPFTFHPTRQFLGLRVARAEYARGRTDVPVAERRAIEANGRSAPHLEPRLLEAAVVLGYRLLGGERIWLAGLISSIVWVLGGACLFLLARRLASDLVAWVAIGIHLFLPYGVVASRTFQPDPTMVTLLLCALLAAVRYRSAPTTATLASAAVVSGPAVLVKPMSVFIVLGGYAAITVARDGIRRGLVSRGTAVFLLVALVPAAAFYGQGIVRGASVASNAETSFIPALFTQWAYWSGWIRMIQGTVTTPLAVVALIAIVVARSRDARFVLAGMWGGYLVFGLVFNYHIHTHDYYQLQFIPVAALGVGLSTDAIAVRVRRMGLSRVTAVALGASLVVLGTSIVYADIGAVRERPVPPAATVVAEAEAIGRIVSHSTRTMMLAPAYGWPLGYEGGLSGLSWPTYASGDFRAMRLNGKAVPSTGELFEAAARSSDWFVVTDLDELRRQPDLKPLLDTRARLVARGAGYLVYDLRGVVPAPAP